MSFLSKEFQDYGHLTQNDLDVIENDHAFAERCKKDGILTYSREFNELKEKLNAMGSNHVIACSGHCCDFQGVVTKELLVNKK